MGSKSGDATLSWFLAKLEPQTTNRRRMNKTRVHVGPRGLKNEHVFEGGNTAVPVPRPSSIGNFGTTKCKSRDRPLLSGLQILQALLVIVRTWHVGT